MTDTSARSPARRWPCPGLRGDRSGSVVSEYAMIAAMVAITAIAALLLFTDSADSVWSTVGREVGGALGGP